MVESKSGWTFNEINARSEKSMESDPRCPNRLGVDSEWISPRTVKPRRSSCFAETLEWNKSSSSESGVQNREDLMDRTTRCPKCGKRMVPVVTLSGRTDLQCISCDDPAVKWAESPLTAPEKPIVAEPA